MSDDENLVAYVKTCSRLLALPLDEARAQRVAGHLARTASMAALLEAVSLAAEDEPAELYCPAVFRAVLPPSP